MPTATDPPTAFVAAYARAYNEQAWMLEEALALVEDSRNLFANAPIYEAVQFVMSMEVHAMNFVRSPEIYSRVLEANRRRVRNKLGF